MNINIGMITVIRLPYISENGAKASGELDYDLPLGKTQMTVKHAPIGPGTNLSMKSKRPRVITSVETLYSLVTN